MKRFTNLIVMLSFLIVSCGESDPNDIDPIDIDVTFEVDLSGEFVSAFVQDSVSAFTHAELILIKGFDTGRNMVELIIDPSMISEIVGTHDVTRDSATRIRIQLADGTTFYLADSGTLTVTEYRNKVMKGTFNFESTKHNDPTKSVSGSSGVFVVAID